MLKQALLLAACFALPTLAGLAQPAQSVTQAIQYIKLANTLRAVNKSDESVKLLNRALPAVAKHAYWKAVTHELLGLSHNDLRQTDAALRYLTQARTEYANLKYVASAWGVNEIIRELSGKNLYAGIQIGANGVKLAIFKTQYESDFYEKDVRSVINLPNVTLVADAANGFNQGRLAIRECLDSIRRYNIPNERVFLVFGSDVRASGVDRNRLYDQLSAALPEGTGLRIDTAISLKREAELFTVGTIPRVVWPSTSALNVGNDNVVGGYVDARKTFHAVTLPVGVNTLTEQIDPRRSLSIDAFRRETDRVVRTLPAINVPTGIRERRTVGLGGTTAQALVTFLHPERAMTTAVPISMDDIARFKQLVYNDFATLVRPDLSAISDPALRERASRDIGQIQNQVNQKQLIAGIGLLELLVDTYNAGGAPKRFVFIRNADIGWVTGKFLETINYEYESTIAKGALYTR